MMFSNHARLLFCFYFSSLLVFGIARFCTDQIFGTVAVEETVYQLSNKFSVLFQGLEDQVENMSNAERYFLSCSPAQVSREHFTATQSRFLCFCRGNATKRGLLTKFFAAGHKELQNLLSTIAIFSICLILNNVFNSNRLIDIA